MAIRQNDRDRLMATATFMQYPGYRFGDAF
jgi:hypothetical protein